jgi:hypothetical protein
VQIEANTEKLSEALAEAANAEPFGGSWKTTIATPAYGPNIQFVTANFGLQDGATVSETVPVGTDGGSFSVSVSSLETTEPGKLLTEEGHVTMSLTLAEGLAFDRKAPLSLIAHPDYARTFSGAYHKGGEFLPLLVSDGPPEPPEYTNIVAEGGTLFNELDGSGLGITANSSIADLSQQYAEESVAATYLETEFALQRVLPFSGSNGLQVELAQIAYAPAIEKLLRKTRVALTHRNFSAAAENMAKVVTELQKPSDLPLGMVQASAEQIAAHLGWLAGH